MIRVLMIGNDSSVKGGITSVINQFKENLWSEDFELDYLSTYKYQDNFRKILFFASKYFALCRMLRKKKYDIIHIHMAYGGSFWRKYLIFKKCRRKGLKIILHLHGSCFRDWFENASMRAKEKTVLMFEQVDALIVLGDKWKNYVESIAPKSRIVVLNNSVKIPGETTKYCEPFKFLFLGVLTKRKGVYDIVTALSMLPMDIQEKIRVIIGGSGEEEIRLKREITKQKLQDNILFRGWVSGYDKECLFRDCQAFLLPSYNEGLPVAILEAMSYGMPVISTNVGDIETAVYDGINGFIVMPGDCNALKNALMKLLDQRKYNEFSQMSRSLCETKFSSDIYFEKVAELYRQVYVCELKHGKI